MSALWAAWKDRHRNEVRGYRRHEAEFLPGAMEIEERPPNPAAGILMYILIGGFLLFLGFIYFLKLDIVAVAQGKLKPVGEVQLVQSAVAGTVTQILVRNGDQVSKGGVLLELDRTALQAESRRLESDRAEALLSEVEARLLDHANFDADVSAPSLRDSPELDDIDPALVQSAQLHLEAQFQEQKAQRQYRKSSMGVIRQQQQTLHGQIDQLKKQIANLEEELRVSQGNIEQELSLQRGMQKLAEIEYARQQQLFERDVVSKAAVESSEAELLEIRRQTTAVANQLKNVAIATQKGIVELETIMLQHRDRIAELEAELLRIEHEGDLATSTFILSNRKVLGEAGTTRRTLETEIVKLKEQEKAHVITAPVDGVVERLEVHTTGAVLQPSQMLMAIVPSDASLEVELLVENKDVGFVRVGQRVALKLEAFPHFKYGLLEGELLDISDDAIEVEGVGLVYVARVAIFQDSVAVDGKDVKLAAGMSVGGEIRTGERKLYEFFLEPLLGHSEEIFDER